MNPSDANSSLATLRQLKEMLDAGTLTPQEFEALKQKLVFSDSATAENSGTASQAGSAAIGAEADTLAYSTASLAVVPVEPTSELLPPDSEPIGSFGTPVAPPPAAPTETPEWLAAPAPMLFTSHEAPHATTERRNPLTLVFAIGGALVLLALVLYLTFDYREVHEQVGSAPQTTADSTAVAPEATVPQSEQITLPPATAPETVRVAPAKPLPTVPSAATKFHTDSVAVPAPAKEPAMQVVTDSTAP